MILAKEPKMAPFGFPLKLLNDLGTEFFGYSVSEGMVVPDHPEYWSIKEGQSLVFMRGAV